MACWHWIAQKLPGGPKHDGLPSLQVSMALAQLIEASGETHFTSDAVLHDGDPEHVIPQNVDARKSMPLSQDLSPAQFAMQIDSSHLGGAALQDSAVHWKSQRSDSHAIGPLHDMEPEHSSVQECPPTH